MTPEAYTFLTINMVYVREYHIRPGIAFKNDIVI
jgi:hypothetical protein